MMPKPTDLLQKLDDLYDSGYKPNEFEKQFLINIEIELNKTGEITLTNRQSDLLDKILVKCKSRWNRTDDAGYI